MAAITDLTWTQLAAKLPPNAIILSDGVAPVTSGVYINLSNLTGDTISSLSSQKVVEALLKLVQAGREAQTTANTGQVSGEQMNAFPAPTTGNSSITSEGLKTITSYSVQALTVTNFDSAIAPTV